MSSVQSVRKTGVVKFFNQTSGYGFITPDEGGKDIFVHQSDLSKSDKDQLQQNEKVSFEVVTTPKGPKAIKLEDV